MKNILLIICSIITSIVQSQTDIFTTDFQTGIPLNYSIIDNDGQIPASQVSEYTSAWISVIDPNNLNDTIAASTSYFSPIGLANRWLIAPPFLVGSYGNFIEWEAKSQDAANPDDYLVLVSTTNNQISSFTDTIGYIIEENFEWTNRAVNLSAYGYTNQTIYVAFVNVTNDGFKLYIDDIHAWKEDPLTIDQLNQSDVISIFPNPSNGKFSTSTSSKLNKATVTNTFGQTILTSIEPNFDLTPYPNGIYFVQIETQLGKSILKIIKN